jgi:hypothetical protein
MTTPSAQGAVDRGVPAWNRWVESFLNTRLALSGILILSWPKVGWDNCAPWFSMVRITITPEWVGLLIQTRFPALCWLS